MKINITRKRIRTSRIILSTIGVIAIAIGVFSYLQPTSRAANLSSFDPGNIMSDYVMGNKNSMTEAQIQTFLESKNACNNTNISKASVYHKVKDGRFVCMYEDTFDGETAAHIIWQAGQDYSINPRVIIVLLQKEQGLITDTWPNSIQYNKATGYGCPDTAACDTQYYGLKNQIRQAANLFRNVLNGGWSNYPVGNNYVQYHPNAACGGTTVNIKNRATSALYRYTPYQPNQAALNAGYGTGDSCSAYGNRNFWLYFTDWFGDTQGVVIKGSIGLRYKDVNGIDTLGLPLYNERNDGRMTWWQCFEQGCIIGNRNTGYWESKGSIRSKWAELGYQDGALGMPTSGEIYNSTLGSWEQSFEKGKIITYAHGANKHAIKGSIYKAYDSFGKETLSLPSDDEKTDGKGTWWQKFGQNEAIIGNRNTGYWESKGSIRSKWAELGYQDGALGMPVGHEVKSENNCYSQEYENGKISGCAGNYTYELKSSS